jgi:hypothetical protein
MAQTRNADQVMARDGETTCSLVCDCWDCHSYRRHLLKLTTALLLACGLGGEVAWKQGVWRGTTEATAGAEVELASVASSGQAMWF